MDIKQQLHSFDLTRTEMEALQLQLQSQIQITPYSGQPQIVAGVDLAYFDNQAIAVIVAMDVATKKVIETVSYMDTVSNDYIPGFLAFRELPLFLEAWKKLKSSPDLVFFDGNGILHPHRVGIATHASFWIDKPTIGIAKTPMIGTYQTPSPVQGSYEWIYDQDEIIGAVLRTQTDVKPVYVSVGNRVTLQNTIDFTMHWVGNKSRIPEITRQPDLLTRELRRDYLHSQKNG
ncbi:endonuclease V [Hazenella coriacea]|uniref:Endonuclease V n=1 Tax=Hazenella coriacea TaxID=1179467 RepID=A0A4R3LE15_9BACL|nr:endonuclease V [Hazenella coriacea]TCS96574.1 endonuclease V [Hazenella coriacea]